MVNLYKLFYKLEDIEPVLDKALEFLNTKLDITDSTSLIERREEGRLLLQNVSKCYMTLDYNNKKLGSRTGPEYALYSSLKEYAELTQKNLETTLFSIANTINYYRQER